MEGGTAPASRANEPSSGQRRRGTGSISEKPRADGRFKVSVARADGKGRRWAYVRSFAEQEAKVQELLNGENAKRRELLNIEAGAGEHGDAIADHLDAMLEKWRTARNDPEQRDWVIRQWVKLFRLPPPLEDDDDDREDE